jgi:hypothetical protein
MSTDISIRVPKDGYACRVRGMGRHFRGSVYQKIHHGKLANYMVKKDKNKGRVSLRYLCTKPIRFVSPLVIPTSALLLVSKFNYENFLRGSHV